MFRKTLTPDEAENILNPCEGHRDDAAHHDDDEVEPEKAIEHLILACRKSSGIYSEWDSGRRHTLPS